MSDKVIGGVGLTHLKVYDQRPGPDGVQAGCAHIHALTDEAYFGIAGEGAIELHDIEKGFRKIAISKGTYVQFGPGILHRSVCTNSLEVVALMGNAGLAERGDARIYFGAEVDADASEYERLNGLVANGLGGALERRDASTWAYQKLIALWENDKAVYRSELERFFNLHKASIAENAAQFLPAIKGGPVRSGEVALGRVAGLSQTRWSTGADIAMAIVSSGEPTLGMCGLLRQVDNLTDLS